MKIKTGKVAVISCLKHDEFDFLSELITITKKLAKKRLSKKALSQAQDKELQKLAKKLNLKENK